MMQFAHKFIKEAKNLRFYRLLGSGGGNGFSIKANFSVYAFLGVWEDQESAETFFKNGKLFNLYRTRAAQMWTVFMYPVRSRGEWGGVNPFKPDYKTEWDGPVCVITRATIRLSRLFKFWRYVPVASGILNEQKNLIASFGIGEWPIVQMATFSIWRDQENMKNYAYKSKEHLGAIKKTHELDWYREELFSRFIPFRSEGTWNGKNPLEGLL